MAINRNAEGYIDPTAGKAISNVIKSERKKRMDVLKGDIVVYEDAKGKKRFVLVVSEDSFNKYSSFINVLYLYEANGTSNGKYDVEVNCRGKHVVKCTSFATLEQKHFIEFVRRITDEEMALVEAGILKALGIKKVADKKVDSERYDLATFTRYMAEAKIYKEMYETLLEKVVNHG